MDPTSSVTAAAAATDPTESDLQAEIELRAAAVRAAEAERSALEQELPELIAEHGRRLDAIRAHEPQVHAALKMAQAEGGVAAYIDSFWRVEHKDEALVLNEREKLKKHADELEGPIRSRQNRLTQLPAFIAHLSGQLDEAEQVLAAYRAEQLEAVARRQRGERTAFATIRDRVLGRVAPS